MKNICSFIKSDYSKLPVRVLQFGQGNFLRAFADWIIDKANANSLFNGSIVIAKSTSRGSLDNFVNQNYNYTVACRGRDAKGVVEDYDIVSSVKSIYTCTRQWHELVDVAVSNSLSVIISNTTEAGICFDDKDDLNNPSAATYPGKLTALLFERFKSGNTNKLLVLPVELIEDNGTTLKKCVLKYIDLWSLGNEFADYINSSCCFANTLVDRIVTGFPDDNNEICAKLGYSDNLTVACEPYFSWIIQCDESFKTLFPMEKIHSGIKWVNDIKPYRERKVKILNGAHTVSVLSAYLAGFDIVRDMMHDETYFKFINSVLQNEIMKTINLPQDELLQFASSVFERFDNPFIDHKLLDISLNSVSKFAARCLPSLIEYYNKFKVAPKLLCFGFASLIKFYCGTFENGEFYGKREQGKYSIKDNSNVLNYFQNAYKTDDVVKAILENEDFWGVNLAQNIDIYSCVKHCFDLIEKNSMKNALNLVLNNE